MVTGYLLFGLNIINNQLKFNLLYSIFLFYQLRVNPLNLKDKLKIFLLLIKSSKITPFIYLRHYRVFERVTMISILLKTENHRPSVNSKMTGIKMGFLKIKSIDFQNISFIIKK